MTRQGNDRPLDGHLYAHSLPGGSGRPWEGLDEHAAAVAELGAQFGAAFGWGETVRVMARLHDAGKASEEFQAYIRGARTKGGDHSTWGARIAAELYRPPVGRYMAACIAGHHAGLPDGDSLAHRLDRANAPVPDASRWRADPALPPLRDLRPSRLPSVPGRDRLKERDGALEARQAFTEAFLIRMLFSCLVDADFLATEHFMSGGTVRRGVAADFGTLHARLTAHLDEKTRTADPTPLNALRASILAHAVAKAGMEPGLFTLTVPTGGGKTLTSLAFALDHAVRHGRRRIVFVIPFTGARIETSFVIVSRTALGERCRSLTGARIETCRASNMILPSLSRGRSLTEARIETRRSSGRELRALSLPHGSVHRNIFDNRTRILIAGRSLTGAWISWVGRRLSSSASTI